jgi:SpoVK/Ycf46/Vps4 family AAA+-type ATPase
MVKHRTDDAASAAEKPINKAKLSELLQNDLSKRQVDSILSKYSSSGEDDAITLDDILNLWDGLCETPHRILVITSNHYDQLDPALVRPGRIDLTLKMGHVTPEVLQEMFAHLFDKPWPADEAVPDTTADLTPAKIINVFLQSGRDETRFLLGLRGARFAII